MVITASAVSLFELSDGLLQTDTDRAMLRICNMHVQGAFQAIGHLEMEYSIGDENSRKGRIRAKVEVVSHILHIHNSLS